MKYPIEITIKVPAVFNKSAGTSGKTIPVITYTTLIGKKTDSAFVKYNSRINRDARDRFSGAYARSDSIEKLSLDTITVMIDMMIMTNGSA
jgi:hypothetical protein